MEENVVHSGHETLDISQHHEAQITELDEATIQDSNGNTTTAVCVLKEESLDKGTSVESPLVVHQDSPTVERY